MFDKAFKRVNKFEDFRAELVQGQDKEKRPGEELTKESAKKQKKRIVGNKSYLNVVGITAAHIDVNAALMELVLLVYFNEKYAK
nr:hypothetical protein [Tanacetum cinerariifolium]